MKDWETSAGRDTTLMHLRSSRRAKARRAIITRGFDVREFAFSRFCLQQDLSLSGALSDFTFSIGPRKRRAMRPHLNIPRDMIALLLLLLHRYLVVFHVRNNSRNFIPRIFRRIVQGIRERVRHAMQSVR